jgi:hypothetical protein
MAHVVWVLMAMKLVSGSQGAALSTVSASAGNYVPVDSVPRYEQVEVAVYTDEYTCKVWAQRLANMSGYKANSALCQQRPVK